MMSKPILFWKSDDLSVFDKANHSTPCVLKIVALKIAIVKRRIKNDCFVCI